MMKDHTRRRLFRNPTQQNQKQNSTKKKARFRWILFFGLLGLVIIYSLLLRIILQNTINNEYSHQSQSPNENDFTLKSKQQQQQQPPTGQVDLSIIPEDPTKFSLALLYPPGLIGGYRNEVIRFLSFVMHAVHKNITQLWLPSLIWNTFIFDNVANKTIWTPIAMADLFDINHWNQIAQSTNGAIPKLVMPTKTLSNSNNDNNDDFDCWTWDLPQSTSPNITTISTTQSILSQGFFTPLVEYTKLLQNNTLHKYNFRRIDLLQNLSHCQHPFVYGGGQGAGRLWNDYLYYQNKKLIPQHVHAAVLNALQPKPIFRQLSQQCIKEQSESPHYIAIHARVELEMMAHKCGRLMEFNLTKIFQMVTNKFMNTTTTITNDEKFKNEGNNGNNKLFVAVSRSGMGNASSFYSKFQSISDWNVQTLDNGIANGQVLECGEAYFEKQQPRGKLKNNDDDKDNNNINMFGSLFHSMLNFDLAVQSKIFVGVRGSSYSTDIWTTRYYQGLGSSNYEYTQDGVVPIENGGLPAPHKNCAKKGSKSIYA